MGWQPLPEEMTDGIADQRVRVERLRGDQLGLQEPFGGSRFLSADVGECPSRIGVEGCLPVWNVDDLGKDIGSRGDSVAVMPESALTLIRWFLTFVGPKLR